MVLSGFPRWSETFALPELIALEEKGLLGPIFATKPGDDFEPQPAARQFLDQVERIPAGSEASQARWLAKRLETEPVSAIHAYFAHTPAGVAQRAAEHLSIPFGFSAHARDVRKISDQDLENRSRNAACVVACNDDVAAELRRAGASVTLLAHGVDLTRFLPSQRTSRGPFRLLAVGRMVPKKGFDTLIAACSLLDREFSLKFVGIGPEEDRLRQQTKQLGLEDFVEFAGLINHEGLPNLYKASDLVVVPSVVDSSGDRDGLPNVVLEAFASGRAVIASRVAAIDSAVRSGVNGLLVDPNDPVELSRAIQSLSDDSDRLDEFGDAARRTANYFYDANRCAAAFAVYLREAYAISR